MGAARVAGQGAEAFGRAAAPVAGQAIENYMVRTGGILPMDTWHGSPHRFPPTAKNPLGEFDPMKIGTGEGAQAYGAGAGYLAENRGVAKGYRDALTPRTGMWDATVNGQNLFDAAANHGTTGYASAFSQKYFDLVKDGKTANQAKQQISNQLNKRIALAKSPGDVKGAQEALDFISNAKISMPDGSLYKVDLPDEQIAKMLDWDKPLSQQSWYRPVADVVKEYKGAGKDVDAYAKLISKANARDGEVTGQQFYEGTLSQFGGSQAKVSEFMREAGIPGIRYLDQGSRAGGQGTSNFVVFDPAHMNIIGRE